jgi:ADP-heptose:LPS heptosyltransferase
MFRTQGLSELRHQTPKRICIIKPSALGDVVQALPLLPVLKARFPAATISWVINRELRDLVDGHPQVDEVIAFERRGQWREWLRLLSHLRSQRFDLVFDFQGLARSALMTLATGARWRVGLQTAREGASLVTNSVIPDTGWNVPAHARLWRLAEVLDLADLPRQAQVPATELDRVWAAELLQKLPRPVIAVHAGAGWVTKRWPLEKFAELLNRCSETWNSSTILLGGPGERREVDQLQLLLGNHSEAVNLAGKTTIRQLAHLLTQVDLTISNESGPMHMSAEL